MRRAIASSIRPSNISSTPTTKPSVHGIRARSAYLKVIGDFTRWNDRLVFGCDDSAKSEFLNKRKVKGGIDSIGQSQSNLWFTSPDTPGKLDSAEALARATSVRVLARAATDDEREAVWARATELYSGFAKYRERITERPVRIFVLEASA